MRFIMAHAGGRAPHLGDFWCLRSRRREIAHLVPRRRRPSVSDCSDPTCECCRAAGLLAGARVERVAVDECYQAPEPRQADGRRWHVDEHKSGNASCRTEQARRRATPRRCWKIALARPSCATPASSTSRARRWRMCTLCSTRRHCRARSSACSASSNHGAAKAGKEGGGGGSGGEERGFLVRGGGGGVPPGSAARFHAARPEHLLMWGGASDKIISEYVRQFSKRCATSRRKANERAGQVYLCSVLFVASCLLAHGTVATQLLHTSVFKISHAEPAGLAHRHEFSSHTASHCLSPTALLLSFCDIRHPTSTHHAHTINNWGPPSPTVFGHTVLHTRIKNGGPKMTLHCQAPFAAALLGTQCIDRLVIAAAAGCRLLLLHRRREVRRAHPIATATSSRPPPPRKAGFSAIGPRWAFRLHRLRRHGREESQQSVLDRHTPPPPPRLALKGRNRSSAATSTTSTAVSHLRNPSSPSSSSPPPPDGGRCCCGGGALFCGSCGGGC